MTDKPDTTDSTPRSREPDSAVRALDRFTEAIGRERPFGGEPSVDIKSRVYTAEGDTVDYVYELEGDSLTIWGGHRDSESCYTATFSAEGNTLSGAWSWPGGGYKTISTRPPGTTT
jgi:hypothetical protein